MLMPIVSDDWEVHTNSTLFLLEYVLPGDVSSQRIVTSPADALETENTKSF